MSAIARVREFKDKHSATYFPDSKWSGKCVAVPVWKWLFHRCGG